jgi:hypothetical protein
MSRNAAHTAMTTDAYLGKTKPLPVATRMAIIATRNAVLVQKTQLPSFDQKNRAAVFMIDSAFFDQRQ